MGEHTDILWTHHTWNAWWGCQKVSPACKNCYAENIATHYKHAVWGPSSTTDRWILSEANFKKPVQWNKKALQDGVRRRVFFASMSDVFEDHPQVIEARKRALALVEQTPQLDWLMLTKRPENIMNMVPPRWRLCFPRNVWIGTSVESQKYALERIPTLIKVPARVHFLSVEPMLSAVDLTSWLSQLEWVICGGESGIEAHLHQLNPLWARSLRDQCVAYEVPFFFKQWGGRHHDTGGRDLDGRTWDQFPGVLQEVSSW